MRSRLTWRLAACAIAFTAGGGGLGVAQTPPPEAPPAAASGAAPLTPPPTVLLPPDTPPAAAPASDSPPVKAAAPPPPVRRPAAILQALDKVTAETLRFEAPVGQPIRYKDLVFIVHVCEEGGPAQAQGMKGAAAHLEIDSQPKPSPGRAPAPSRQLFKGWMFAASPGLHPFEHPVYDAWLISCRDPNPPPPAPKPAPKPPAPATPAAPTAAAPKPVG